MVSRITSNALSLAREKDGDAEESGRRVDLTDLEEQVSQLLTLKSAGHYIRPILEEIASRIIAIKPDQFKDDIREFFSTLLQLSTLLHSVMKLILRLYFDPDGTSPNTALLVAVMKQGRIVIEGIVKNYGGRDNEVTCIWGEGGGAFIQAGSHLTIFILCPPSPFFPPVVLKSHFKSHRPSIRQILLNVDSLGRILDSLCKSCKSDESRGRPSALRPQVPTSKTAVEKLRQFKKALYATHNMVEEVKNAHAEQLPVLNAKKTSNKRTRREREESEEEESEEEEEAADDADDDDDDDGSIADDDTEVEGTPAASAQRPNKRIRTK